MYTVRVSCDRCGRSSTFSSETVNRACPFCEPMKSKRERERRNARNGKEKVRPVVLMADATEDTEGFLDDIRSMRRHPTNGHTDDS